MNIDLNSQNEDSSPSDSTDGKGGFKFLHLFLAFLLGGVLTAGVFLVPSFGGQGFIGARQTVTDPMSGTVGMAQRVTDQKYLNAEQYVNEAQELREEAQLLIEEVVTAVRAELELRARSEFGVAISELAEAEDDFELAVALNERFAVSTYLN